jgi:hypothetical protein
MEILALGWGDRAVFIAGVGVVVYRDSRHFLLIMMRLKQNYGG